MGEARMLSVAAITGGRDVPSARFRVRQYIQALQTHGVNITEFESHTSAYPPQQRWVRPAWAALRLVEMARIALQTRRYDVTLLQREMISTLATLERWTGRPRVLDVDDSIHLYRDGATTKSLAMHSDRIICGNPYLADIYRKWNSDVVVLPTAVDTDRYRPCEIESDGESIVLGWIGTSANLRYLHEIGPALATVLKRHPKVMLHIVCNKPPKIQEVENSRVKYTPWSPAVEVSAIQSFDIGLMPLEDSLWARGKCSFKMLQYMACGLPVAVSPVGMNADVLGLGDIGRGPRTISEWEESLLELVENKQERLQMGIIGRQIVVREFSVVNLAPRFADFLRFTRSDK
jgi:glycosyltransferase involved in cell wall biosynthesis